PELPSYARAVLLDLLDAGGARDHAGNLRPASEPGERQFKHRVAARLGKGLQLFDDLLVAWRDIAIAQPRDLVEPGIVGGGPGPPVLAGGGGAPPREKTRHA